MSKRVFIVDDEPQYGKLYAIALGDAGFDVSTFSRADDALASAPAPDMIVSDMRMHPMNGIDFLHACREQGWHMPFLFVTAHGDLRQAVQAVKLGAVDYLEKPVDLDELITAVCEATGAETNPRLDELPFLEELGIIVESSLMRHIYRDADQVARTDTTVLLTGESGCGKDVLARAIHERSARSAKPFVAINCAAIPHELLGSELFGHEKGAFTGATQTRKGRFREAEGGTLFLDEIGDMPAELQASLLRALEQRTVQPVGSDREVPVDIRLIAATNADLETRIHEGRFREDLFYRLNVIAFAIPPLRERREEILPLAHHFLQQHERHYRFSSSAERLVSSYDWPGNVRELANAMERAAILANAGVILPEHLPAQIGNQQKSPVPADTARPHSLQQSEHAAIVKALESTGGNRTHAAQLLGISRRALLYKIKRYAILQ